MPPSYQSEIVATASAALLGVIGAIAITKPDLAGGAGLNEVSIDCRVEARGNSRRQCGWRPLRFHFNGDPGGTIFTGTGRFIDFVTHCGFRPGQWEGLAGLGYQTEGWARRFFDNWRDSLKWQRLKPYEKFAEMIESHWDGIAAYCRPENKVALGFVEGVNNKIRVIQRRSYGLRDEEYLRLKILTCMLSQI